MTCPECGGELKNEIEGSSLIVICEDCGWSVATTYTEPIYLDEGLYRLEIDAGNLITKTTLAAVSHAIGRNYLKAKEFIEGAPALVAEDRAPEVQRLARVLADAGVKYSIEPEFPYEI